MKTYLVGGAVRDRILGLVVKEKDWVVVGSTIQEMRDKGFQQLDNDFPVFLHPQTKEEYALARKEIKTGQGYKGFQFDISSDITLEDDLQRRDLTINAIAEDQEGVLVDPFNGQEDLQLGWLRAVTERFTEDPLRLLRLCRFNCKLGNAGFRPTHKTWSLMKSMANQELKTLSKERQWKEMSKALAEPEPWRYFLLLNRCGALQVMQPVLAKYFPVADVHGEEPELVWLVNMKRAVKASLPVDEVFIVALISNSIVLQDAGILIEQLGIGKKYGELLSKSILLKENLLTLLKGTGNDVFNILEGLGFQKNKTLFTALINILEVTESEKMNLLITRVNLAKDTLKEIDSKSLIEQGFKGKALGEHLIKQRAALFDTKCRQLHSDNDKGKRD